MALCGGPEEDPGGPDPGVGPGGQVRGWVQEVQIRGWGQGSRSEGGVRGRSRGVGPDARVQPVDPGLQIYKSRGGARHSDAGGVWTSNQRVNLGVQVLKSAGVNGSRGSEWVQSWN